MFAFAIWDASRAGGWCWPATASARSRCSTAAATEPVWFASELDALLQDRRSHAELDLAAIDAYLAYQYVPLR